MLTRRHLLAGTFGALAVPLAAEAQQVAKTTRIGVLFTVSPAVAAPNLEAFRKGLRQLGHAEGKTFVVLPRYGGGKAEGLPELTRELVSLKVDVLVVSTDLAAAAARRETQTIPIVMALSTDPVGTGFVASLARPGGNVTGLTILAPELSGKRLQLLREAVPGLSRVSLLWNPDVRGAVLDYKETESAARSLRLLLQSIEVARVEDLDRAFAVIAKEHAQALIVQGPNPVLFTNQDRILNFAQRSRLPVMYPVREYVDAGGLMSYGSSQTDLFRRVATYVDKIIQGAKPADLPIEQPTKFELVINLKIATALGLTIPPSLRARADQVLE
jgi:putative ABC transport system substrate-binding protein